MERTSKAIGRLLFNSQFLFSLSALLFLLQPSLLAESGFEPERGKFVLIEYPGSLRMYNQYEQRLSPLERGRMVPFLPMRVLEQSGFLSDGFTPCMKVEVEGMLFYIQVDEKGRPVSAGGEGLFQEYANVIPLDGIVRVHTTGRLTFTSAKGKRSILERDALLKRYFSYGGSMFVRRVDKDSSFGWVKLDSGAENSTWSILMPPAERGIPSSVTERVGIRLHEVNRYLRVLFEQFSKQSGRAHETPEWKAGRERTALVCILTRDSSSHAFWESTRLLANDIEGFLIGTDLTMTVSPRRIEIRPR